MRIEYIYDAESIDNVVFYIQAMLHRTKVSFATLLSTYYFYFASDAWKCIHYCIHCRKSKCIHYYSCNFRLFTFYYNSDSIWKTFTKYNTCRYADLPLSYSLIRNTATQFLVGNLSRNLLGILHMCDRMWGDITIVRYMFEIKIYAYMLDSNSLLLLCHLTSYFCLGGNTNRTFI